MLLVLCFTDVHDFCCFVVSLTYIFSSDCVLAPMQKNDVDCGVFVSRYMMSMYQLRDQKITYSDIDTGNAGMIILDAMKFKSDDIQSLRSTTYDLIQDLSKLFIRDRHLYTHRENGHFDMAEQEMVSHPSARKFMKDIIDIEDNRKLLFVVKS